MGADAAGKPVPHGRDVRAAGVPATLTEALRVAARRWPDRIAWTFDPGDRFTFADVDRLAAGYALALRERGVRAGHRVAVLLANEPAFPLTWLALARLGAAIVPVNTKYQTADAEHVLRACDASALVAGARFEPLLRRLPVDLPALRRTLPAAEIAAAAARESAPPDPADPDPDPAGTANIQFTSGTTGRPKGCVLPHRYWTQLAGSLVTEFPYLRERDVMLTAQPFHYIDPQWNVAAALLSGAELVVLDGFHPSSFWAKVRQHRVTYFYCLGAMPTLLLRMPADPADRDHSVRAVQCSAIPPALHATLEERWGVPWYEAFGMTETGADLRVTDRDHDELVGTGCLGRPAGHRRVRIVDAAGQPVPAGQTGEITLAGPGMMDGYYGDPEATARVLWGGGEAGGAERTWLHTGDLGRMDAEGRVYHAGRLKDMIRRSGENVAAREVEEVLLTHPGIRLAAVTGVPDEIRGEEVKAYYVPAGPAPAGPSLAGPAPDGTAPDGPSLAGPAPDGTAPAGPSLAGLGPAELARYCQERLAAFKVPRYWQPAGDLPRTDSERVVKNRLGELAGPMFDASTGEWAGQNGRAGA